MTRENEVELNKILGCIFCKQSDPHDTKEGEKSESVEIKRCVPTVDIRGCHGTEQDHPKTARKLHATKDQLLSPGGTVRID